jgi:UDP-N-acetylglucosamine 2-epimerase (non-hydrolysing)/GDP/UDP-N,N'-diacetylbacillosamine 2-epimerase (hydrolysing)
LLTREELESQLEIRLQADSMLVAYHPVTIAQNTLVEADALFEALDRTPGQILFCFPNADAGSRALIERTRLFAATRRDACVFVNLDVLAYWSLLRQVNLFLGNSSSGIMETASFALPTVNVGLRQQGRERAQNIIDAAAEAKSIIGAIEKTRSPEFRKALQGMTNPYGNGTAAETIVRILTTVPLGEKLLLKRHREDFGSA